MSASSLGIPQLGLGTWKSTPQEVVTAVKTALECGYRHIDTAFAYQNEEAVGEALNDCFRRGVCRREDVWVTTKLWNTAHSHVLEGCQASLRALHLDYIDLYLMHWPVAWKACAEVFPEHPEPDPVTLEQTWRAMEDLVARGLVKHIGVSNMSRRLLDKFLPTCHIKPAVNQVEMHPLLPQTPLVRYCLERGIHVTAYSPLGSPDFNRSARSLINDPVLVEIGAKHHKTSAQVAIRWALQRENHALSVIPKSVTPSRIRENFEAQHFELDEDDMRRIDLMACGHRYIRVPWDAAAGCFDEDA